MYRPTTKKSKGIRPIAFLLAATLLVAAGIQSAYATTNDNNFLTASGKAFVSVVKKVAPAVVHVRVEKTLKNTNGMAGQGNQFYNMPFFQQFFGPQFRFQQPQAYKQMALGSGFIISKDGYILTNNHVVSHADKITVILNNKEEYKAKLIGTDPETDIALIKIKDGDNLPTVQLGDSSKLQVGEWVLAIGNPFGLSQTVTAGIVSATGRDRVGINDYEDFIQTDAAINPGNSGGPLINIHGQVIGINSALYTKSGGYMGIGFAIPINMVKHVEAQLKAHGKVVRGWLGVVIQDVSENLAKSFNLKKPEGILVSQVEQGSPAAKAGLQQGDVIIKYDGKTPANVNALRNMVALTNPKTEVNLEIIRNGKTKNIAVTIGEQPANFQQRVSSVLGGAAPGASPLNKFGLAFQNLTPELEQQFGYKQGQGVIISEVKPGSPAAMAGLQPGLLVEEVNRHRVHNTMELKRVLKKSPKANRILLRVRNGDYSQYVVLTTE